MKHAKSMKSRLVIPFCMILVFQTVFMMVFLSTGTVAKSLYVNEINAIEKDVQNCELLLDREMVQHWMTDIRKSSTIQKQIADFLEESGKTGEDIHSDWQLNSELLYRITPSLVELLHRSYGNGVFLILDGPAASQSPDGHLAGVSIMDTDSSSFAADNSDLQLERGIALISSEQGIPLARKWQMDFDMTGENQDDYLFFDPYVQAENNAVSAADSGSCAYLGEISPVIQNDTDGISYSIPLVLNDGSVIGVLGGTMLKTQINALLRTELNNSDMDTIQILAKREAGQPRIAPVLTYGSSFNRCFGSAHSLSLTETGWDNINKVTDQQNKNWYAAPLRLSVYGSDSPYNQTEWMIVILKRQSAMESFYKKLINGLLLGCACGMIPGILIALLYGEYFTYPLRRLIKQLRASDKGERISLQKTYISELDELIHVIEHLSDDVAEAALRISRILDASGVPIGVFEYLPGNDEVFCSRSLFELLGLREPDTDYVYLEPDRFDTMLHVLGKGSAEGNGVTLYQRDCKDKKKYLRLKIVKTEKGNQTGVLLDVTEEIEKRHSLELERDYDQLTGLFNRGAFGRTTEALLQNGKLACAGLVMWDLDNLKYVNDTYGHEMGDRYIRLFADQLKRLSLEGAIVERHSGDEFMCFVCGDDESHILAQIHQFFASVRETALQVEDDYELPLRVSAGIAWYPRQARDLQTLAQYADFAMYMAKHSTKGVLQEFDLAIYEKNSYLLSGREELNQLLEREDVPFAFQPILGRDGSVFGYEALMRPNGRILKTILEVLTLAKHQAKLPQFERLTWVAAMKWFRAHEAEMPAKSRLFINSIANTSLQPECLDELVRTYPDLFSRIVLEVTEGEEISGTDMESKTLSVRRTGGLLALDDFGSGYSSEGSLLNLDVDIVKLDMELVKNIHEDTDKQELAANLIHYCKERNILVLAEGVEKAEELQTMLMLGADLFQGYYLGRPEMEIRPINPYVIKKMLTIQTQEKEACKTELSQKI